MIEIREAAAGVACGEERAGGGRAGRVDCFSRYMFVYLTFSMTLEEIIAGSQEPQSPRTRRRLYCIAST
jgi:hypothetical protein